MRQFLLKIIKMLNVDTFNMKSNTVPLTIL